MLTSQRFTLGSAPAYFGSGAIDQLPSILSSLGYRRAFIVTDRGVAGAGISREIEQILQDAGAITAS
ncbi:MAG TPA: iron-containing alcohol dehydrogenase, partial [Chloroflexota bacterium]